MVELVTGSEADAERLQGELSRFNSRAVLPLIEQCMSAASDPDVLHRIDTLEIDLGRVDPQDFEADFLARLKDALPAALAAKIRDDEHQPRWGATDAVAESRLELLAVFARTGHLPWWADVSEPRLMTENLQLLIRNAPGPLARLLRELLLEAVATRRIVQFFDDAMLEQFVHVARPSLSLGPARSVRDMIAAARNAGSNDGEGEIRAAAWSALLRASLGTAGSPRTGPGRFAGQNDADRLWRDVLASLAISVHAPYAALVRSLQQGLGNSEADAVWGRLAAELSEADLTAGGDRDKPAATNAARAAADTRDRPASHTGGPRPDANVGEDGLDPAAMQARSSDTSLYEAESVYVQNAGLAILWPFLERFFEHLGLLDERHFRESASARRAVGLLQYIATGEAMPVEYQLPLNKILCGLDIAEPLEFDPPVSKAEADDCDDLLRAVIAQAPVLKAMSLRAFRGNFLLRGGVLGSRDRAWLLRVERQTHDVVLDRIPWSVEWLRLPWMPVAMRVEW